MSNYAVFILTHGRADRVLTYNTLRRCGYTGKIYLIVDNEDKQIPRYKELYGDQVIVFNKTDMVIRDMVAKVDKRCPAYARNHAFQIARDLGLDYFIELDDDYDRFYYRFNAKLQYTPKLIYSLDSVFSAFVDYFSDIPALTIAMGQGGDYAGGSDGANAIKTKRKAMNSFICSPNRPFEFIGNMNEDTNAYVLAGIRGDLMLTILQTSLYQAQTQAQVGGMTDIYLDNGTYIKSFYTVMLAPSCVKVSVLQKTDSRLHHRINWEHAAVKIVPETYRKA